MIQTGPIRAGRDVNLSVGDKIWMRVKDFSADNESVTLANKPLEPPAPFEWVVFMLGVPGVFFFGWLSQQIEWEQVAGVLFYISLGASIYGAINLMIYYSATIDKLPVGIISLEYVPTGTAQSPSSGHYVLAYVDKANERRTINIDKSRAGLVSVGDVGILVIRAGRLIDFRRSSQF
jgi:hypothetical protein